MKAADYGLRQVEWDHLTALLNREPNDLEARIMSVMWSEHCSYKSTLHLLKTLPKEGPHVVMGPGENAGVIDGGDGIGLAFKVESHNHPSAVAPVQGAATGVGGIIRDVLAIGARPVASMDGLFFGSPDTSLEEGVIKGVGGYGNCVGVPTVGGMTTYDECFAGNPLVNAFTVGTVALDSLVSSQTAKPGQLVALLGSATGRDGIAGASFASGDLEDKAADKLSIQIGDPFAEKKLIECCLAMNEQGLFVAMQDMGAAGILSSSSEVAAKSGVGMTVDFSAVPLRAADMEPWEIALSETQERMLLIIAPDRLEEAQALAKRWEVDLTVIGTVEEGTHYRITWNGEVVADMPASAVGAQCPPALWPLKERPAYPKAQHRAYDAETLKAMLSHFSAADKTWLHSQYDSQVGFDTVRRPGGPLSVIRYGKDRLAALVMEADPWACELSPREGTASVAAAAFRALAACGAEPAGLTNCLNFASPEVPEVAWSLAESVAGLAQACREMGCPVVSGNVSLYNQTPRGAIYPTPLVAVVGLIPSLNAFTPWGNWQEGDALYLIGRPEGRLDGSLASRVSGEPLAGSIPALNWEEERALQQTLRLLARSGLLHSCRALGRGGLARTLALEALQSNRGCQVSFDGTQAELWGDFASCALLSLPEEKAAVLEGLCGAPLAKIGRVEGSNLAFASLSLPVDQLTALYNSENVRRRRTL